METDSATWNDVDHWIAEHLLPDDAVLGEVLASTEQAGLPAINVSPPQGKLLHLLVRALGARRVLELGTLAGYSSIWIARALPAGGRLVTCEVDPHHAEVARRNFERAGVADRVTLHLGPAADTLERLVADGGEPYDLIFIDADKNNYPVYLDWALRLSRPGTVIVADNVVRQGKVLDAADDPVLTGARLFMERLGKEPRVAATAVQTVGSKGYDGFALAVVTS